MEVRFSPEEEARLSQVAAHVGTDVEQLVKGAALELLQRDSLFRAAVREGIARADAGQLIEEDEMEARIGRMLQP